jgi:hypothetical protein
VARAWRRGATCFRLPTQYLENKPLRIPIARWQMPPFLTRDLTWHPSPHVTVRPTSRRSNPLPPLPPQSFAYYSSHATHAKSNTSPPPLFVFSVHSPRGHTRNMGKPKRSGPCKGVPSLSCHSHMGRLLRDNEPSRGRADRWPLVPQPTPAWTSLNLHPYYGPLLFFAS